VHSLLFWADSLASSPHILSPNACKLNLFVVVDLKVYNFYFLNIILLLIDLILQTH